MSEPYNPADVEQACQDHRDRMYDLCRQILGNHHDAEDACQNAVADAIANPPDELKKGWWPWLYRVTENAAKQFIRKEAGARARQRKAPPPAVEDHRPWEEEIRHLLARATRMLDADEQRDFALYKEGALHGLTQREIAKKHDLPLDEVRRRRKKAARTARVAIVAVYLTEHPGHGPARCTTPRELADVEPDSPASRAVITRHIRGCPVCRPKSDHPKKLLKRLLAVAGLGLTVGFLARLLSPKKVAAAAATTLVAMAVTVFVDDDRPTPPDHIPAPSRSAEAAPPHSAPPTITSAPTARPAPSVRAPQPAPPTTTVTTSVDRPEPVIADGWLEYGRIVLDDGGRCDDEDTSGVAAVVRDAREVSAHLRGGGRDIPVPLYGVGGTGWGGEIGPLGADVPPGRYDVVIEAVGTGGGTAAKKIDELTVARCGS